MGSANSWLLANPPRRGFPLSKSLRAWLKGVIASLLHVRIRHWIYFWALLVFVFRMTNTDWGNISAVVAAVILIVTTIIAICKWIIRKKQLSHPFDIYFEKWDVPIPNIPMMPSNDSQYIEIVVRVKAELYVESISIKFQGDGKLPKIHDLYDWSMGRHNKDQQVYVGTIEDGMCWQYTRPLHCNAKSNIKIGIEYVAIDTFNGQIEFTFMAQGLSKWKAIRCNVF